MENQNNSGNNSQKKEESFYKKHGWWIWILAGFILLLCFFRNLEFKNPIFSDETKKEELIIDAIKNNSDRIIDAIDENGDKVGERVDKNTESNNAGFKKISDTLSEMKKCISCPPVVKTKPKPKKNACPPTAKQKSEKKDTLPVSVEEKCQYILWNPDKTKKKIFSSREERQKFADEHGLIIDKEY